MSRIRVISERYQIIVNLVVAPFSSYIKRYGDTKSTVQQLNEITRQAVVGSYFSLSVPSLSVPSTIVAALSLQWFHGM